MLASSTDFLAYVVVMFLLWIYVPYILFRLFAEQNIDLGRSQDETWFEEMIGAFLPSILMHLLPFGIYAWLCHAYPEHFSVDLAVMASMFGQNRGAVSDYIYSGNYLYCIVYLAMLWLNAGIAGWWFGWSASRLCKLDIALDGIEHIRTRDQWMEKVLKTLWKAPPQHRFKRIGTCLDKTPRLAKALRHLRSYAIRIPWFVWARFFHESIVPLYTWRENGAWVRVETTSGDEYWGTFVGYEKTTGGAIDAVRLMDAIKLEKNADSTYAMRALYINWREITQMNVVTNLRERVVNATTPSSEPKLIPMTGLVPRRANPEPVRIVIKRQRPGASRERRYEQIFRIRA